MSTLYIRCASADCVSAIAKELAEYSHSKATKEKTMEVAARLRAHAAALEALSGVLPTEDWLRNEEAELERNLARYSGASAEIPQ